MYVSLQMACDGKLKIYDNNLLRCNEAKTSIKSLLGIYKSKMHVNFLCGAKSIVRFWG